MSDRYFLVKKPKECPFRKLYDINECCVNLATKVYLCTCGHGMHNILNCDNGDTFDEVNCPLKSCKP